jgi:large subunit ribosomal protein L25
MARIEIGGSVHLSELKLPGGVEIVELLHGSDHDQVVAAIQSPRVSDVVDEG